MTIEEYIKEIAEKFCSDYPYVEDEDSIHSQRLWAIESTLGGIAAANDDLHEYQKLLVRALESAEAGFYDALHAGAGTENAMLSRMYALTVAHEIGAVLSKLRNRSKEFCYLERHKDGYLYDAEGTKYLPVKPDKCDGNHAMPECEDPECWHAVIAVI